MSYAPKNGSFSANTANTTILQLRYLNRVSPFISVKIFTICLYFSTFCCGASVASEQQHKQDLRRIYRRENEFSKSSLFTRLLCGFLPVCFAAFYQNALRLLPECIAPRTTLGCVTVVMASFCCVDCG